MLVQLLPFLAEEMKDRSRITGSTRLISSYRCTGLCPGLSTPLSLNCFPERHVSVPPPAYKHWQSFRHQKDTREPRGQAEGSCLGSCRLCHPLVWLLRKSEVAQMAKESILTKEEALAQCMLCWEGDGYLEGPLPLGD